MSNSPDWDSPLTQTSCPLEDLGPLRETDWDERFMGLARHVAEWSKDPSTKVGAVLVGRKRGDVALGYNGFPPGVADYQFRLQNREMKHRLTQHAERNVLDNARFDPEGCTLYVTFFPCSDCAKSIASKGVARVVTPPPTDREPWASDARWTHMILAEAGVEVIRRVVRVKEG